ncbi:hypothetical protein FW755_11610 [Lonepinella koalarum]|uniref:Uncharacterized protein n=1 Tax=Lonepinella koalarum TaxID=53417 RepID=A0A4R1KXJ9_9PAST|nr:hypothetical protein [Lonepinella koalarum]MDH2925584.1 hypothetical protein [Lonepinella koalarum]MDH2925597.1 hypothetical protein [Lonepinella koalarum]MDH2927280.1 hypothetical protein [Lonepinella koalarum]MDH2927304.1 hypothetical protein [Lonepinella koalarum]TCK70146.1 hypothetical protein EV692_1373 [Lonepinella koalarum]
MESLQIFTQFIDNTVNEPNANSLLHTFYTNLSEHEKEIFVIALIGHATTTHKLLEYERMK